MFSHEITELTNAVFMQPAVELMISGNVQAALVFAKLMFTECFRPSLRATAIGILFSGVKRCGGEDVACQQQQISTRKIA